MGYAKKTKAPRYSITFAFPLLILYELLAFALSGPQMTGVRNGADVLLKSAFTALGGRYGLTVFGIVLLGFGLYLVVRDFRKSGKIEGKIFLGMAAESFLYAVLLGGIASTLTSLLLGRITLAVGQMKTFSMPTQIMISLGAGLYEELVFRVILVSGLVLLARYVFGWKPTGSNVFAVIVGALVFSAFHYIGPYGDPFTIESFTFRAVAGLLFSMIYVLRGFGIVAWSHALYDVLLSLLR